MGFKKALWEHLKTRRKYNTLLLKYDVLRDEYEQKVNEMNIERRIHLKRQEIWEQKLKEQEEEIINLKKRGVKRESNTKRTNTRVSKKK